MASAASNIFNTTPFSDEVVQGPQHLPGKVRFAYYDVGGPEISYHSEDNKNHGACDLNPCDGTYRNTFRKDDGMSSSYTKKRDGDWPGDVWFVNQSQVVSFWFLVLLLRAKLGKNVVNFFKSLSLVL